MAREIPTGKYNNDWSLDMRAARNPSEELGGSSNPEESHFSLDRLDEETARNAAETTKPFMDTAVELYDNRMEMWDDMSPKMQESVMGETDLSTLVQYAENKARRSEQVGHALPITDNEQVVIDAYQARLALERAAEACDTKYFAQGEPLDYAMEEADRRARSAPNKEDKRKWNEMAARLFQFSTSFDDEELRKEFGFGRTTSNAGYLLDMVNQTRSEDIRSFSPVQVSDVRRDARMMRDEADMLSFLTELDQSHKTDTFEQPTVSEKRQQPLSDEEVRAWTEKINSIPTSSARPEREIEKPDPTIDIADSYPEAEEMIYSTPDYLEAVIQEAEAYAAFMTGELPGDNKAAHSRNNIVNKRLPALKRIFEMWRTSDVGDDFRKYIAGVINDVIEVKSDNDRFDAQDADTVINNAAWRGKAMARRMARNAPSGGKYGLHLDEAFTHEYFGIA